MIPHSPYGSFFRMPERLPNVGYSDYYIHTFIDVLGNEVRIRVWNYKQHSTTTLESFINEKIENHNKQLKP